jgi:[ribosomal protein S5]-alanine N-acetyltransferase
MIPLSKCTLRSFRAGDEISLQAYADNPVIWNNLLNAFPHPFSMNDAVNWINQNRFDETPAKLAITIDDQVVGGIGITKQTDVYRLSAELGYWLGEPFWNKGIGTEAVQGMVEYSFANFRIIRIYARVFEYNVASMRVLEKAGFQKEAIHRKAIYKGGTIYDEHLYTILNSKATK